MCAHGSQAVFCTTELCLSVDKLQGEEKTTEKELRQCTEVNVYVVYILSTVKTENTYTLPNIKSNQSIVFKKSRKARSILCCPCW